MVELAICTLTSCDLNWALSHLQQKACLCGSKLQEGRKLCLTGLPSIGFAAPRDWAHLNSGFGCKGFFMPLHYFASSHHQTLLRMPVRHSPFAIDLPPGFLKKILTGYQHRRLPHVHVQVLLHYTWLQFLHFLQQYLLQQRFTISSSEYSNSQKHPEQSVIDKAFNIDEKQHT